MKFPRAMWIMPGSGLVLACLLGLGYWRLGSEPSRSGAVREQSLSGALSVPATNIEPRTPHFKPFIFSLTNSDPDALARSLGLAELPSALESLHQPEAAKANPVLKSLLLRNWAGRDPAAAAAWAGRLPAGPERLEAIKVVSAVWAAESRGAAVAWAMQLPEGVERNGALLTIAYELARTEPMEALQLAIELPVDATRDELLSHAASQWGAQAPEAAAAWARQIGDKALRDRILAEIATAWSERDPAPAATLAVSELSAGKVQEDAVVGIVQRWAQREPQQAAIWVNQFPEGPVRQAALQNLVQLWTVQDPTQVGHWLNGLSAGPSRDLAVGNYVVQLAPLHPADAARWAEAIDDEPLRVHRMEAVAEQWLCNDAAAARAWIAQIPLPETAKARLLALGQGLVAH